MRTARDALPGRLKHTTSWLGAYARATPTLVPQPHVFRSNGSLYVVEYRLRWPRVSEGRVAAPSCDYVTTHSAVRVI